MLKKLSKILICTALIFSTITNAQALSSNGADGAFLLNSELTLSVLDGQVFNYTTIDIGVNGILNLFGTTAGSTFSMLASGDINIAGIVNFFTNTNIVSDGAINISGTFDIKNGSALTLISTNATNISGNLLINGNPLPASDGVLVGLNPMIPIQPPVLVAVPESDVYSFLLLGLCLIGLTLRNKTIYC